MCSSGVGKKITNTIKEYFTQILLGLSVNKLGFFERKEKLCEGNNTIEKKLSMNTLENSNFAPMIQSDQQKTFILRPIFKKYF